MSDDRPASDPRPASGGGAPRPHPRPEVPPVQDGSSDDRTTGLPLRGLLLALGDPVVDVAAAPDGLDVQVDNVVILDPEDRTEVREGDLVLLIGARGASARRLEIGRAHV